MARAPSFSSRVGDFRGDQRPRGGKVGARVRRHGGKGLLGGADIAGRQPLFGAQQLVVVVRGGLKGCQFRVGLRGLRMLAGLHQSLRVLLLVFRSLFRLQQAAGGHYHRCRQRRIQRQPWTSSNRCHNLHSQETHHTDTDYSGQFKRRRVGSTWSRRRSAIWAI